MKETRTIIDVIVDFHHLLYNDTVFKQVYEESVPSGGKCFHNAYIATRDTVRRMLGAKDSGELPDIKSLIGRTVEFDLEESPQANDEIPYTPRITSFAFVD